MDWSWWVKSAHVSKPPASPSSYCSTDSATESLLESCSPHAKNSGWMNSRYSLQARCVALPSVPRSKPPDTHRCKSRRTCPSSPCSSILSFVCVPTSAIQYFLLRHRYLLLFLVTHLNYRPERPSLRSGSAGSFLLSNPYLCSDPMAAQPLHRVVTRAWHV